MTGSALVLMIASMALIWGGLAASAVGLARRPENSHMPPGGEDDPTPTD
ncbi:methionine/alanine import family NSS transporter small subunit [Demequina zhanjiangensis]|uniref:Methionine/alanine import family NSS transporter small subunit n=1 Tax=Demequina zhanjiangensis TaxID=3051659 RepID=A0ABT8G3U4_9MICO|nr:methionine/alanine import family NSS transporter small subunit [Demequina sp. SYSU T00b26]MDN4473742.1 methionine/alanine import family NSS transporter small subunit [Demequina sp. SYSU T00b26]